MYLTLDNLAHRYSLLPSEVLERASTLDLYILDLGTRYKNYQHEVAANDGRKPSPKLTTEQMMAMMQRVKEQK